MYTVEHSESSSGNISPNECMKWERKKRINPEDESTLFIIG